MRPQVRAYVYDNGDRVFGPGPRDLLRGVDRTGSLSAAAAGMGMAYTKATRLVCDAERAFGIRLLERKVGGSHGGGSRLTDAARELLDAYGRYEADVRAAAQASFDANLAVLTSDAAPTTPTSCAVSTRHATPFAMPCEPGSVGCVVMAAGASSRFGSDKLAAQLAGMPVLQRTLAAVTSAMPVTDVTCVTRAGEKGDRAAAICASVGVACATHGSALLSDTIRRGLAELGPRDAVLFVQGDQPLLAPKSLREMLRVASDNPGRVVRLSWQGVPVGPTVFPREALGALARLEGDEGGSALLGSGGRLGREAILVEATRSDEAVDVDTPDALVYAESLLRG